MGTLTCETEAVQPSDPDRTWWAHQNAEAHALDLQTPAAALVEPNPRDGWPEWADADCWEAGPEPSDADWDRLCEERWETTTPGGWPTDGDCLPGGIG